MPPDLQDQITAAVEKLGESVVSIDSVRFGRDYRRRVVQMEGQASGVIIDTNGYVVTNNHVVKDAERVQVNLKDGQTLVGEVVGSDPATDVALVKIEAIDLHAARLADSESLRAGQIVLAIGNALGLPGAPTVSMGVISAVGRPLPGSDFVLEGFIQTDAAINPGNSGGPLADIEGNVIGINTAMIPYAQGVGFAIPIDTVKTVLQQILREGKVVRPWLGISGVDVTPAVSRRYDLRTDSGVLVVEVGRGTPAEDAGLAPGDVVLEVGGHEVRRMKDLLSALSKLRIGATPTMTLLRTGRRYQASIRLAERPER